MQDLFDNKAVEEQAGGLAARLDPRTRILLTAVTVVTALVLSDPFVLGTLAVSSAVYMLSTRRYKAIAGAFAVVGCMWLLSLVCLWVLVQLVPSIGGRAFSVEALTAPFLRMLVSVNMVLGMALTIRVGQAQAALYGLCLPGLFSLPLTVMIRFIPTFIHDVKQIHQALILRGHSLTPWSSLRHPYRMLRMVFIPLIFRALRSAEELAVAAELKGLDHCKRPRDMDLQSFAGPDALAFACFAFALGLGMALSAWFGQAAPQVALQGGGLSFWPV
jgi:energy-coupling factor transport system permease protein